MSLLLHINGLPGVGKTTLARLYADEHPLALNLDLDLLRRSIERWQEHLTESGLQARRLAIAAAGTHLRDGFDVVVPQFVARPEFIVDLETVAADTGVLFIEVCLQAHLETVKRRFRDRTERAAEPQHVEAAMTNASDDWDIALDGMSRDLDALLVNRAGVVVVTTEGLTIKESYRAMMSSLGD